MKINFLLLLAIISLNCVIINAQKKPRYTVTQAEIVNANNFEPFEKLKKVSLCRKSLDECASEAMIAHDMDGFGGPETIHFYEHQFRYKRNGKDVGVFVFSILNREEKVSVDERTRIEFVRENGRWKFVTIGNQTRCVNGNRVTKWSKKPCN